MPAAVLVVLAALAALAGWQTVAIDRLLLLWAALALALLAGLRLGSSTTRGGRFSRELWVAGLAIGVAMLAASLQQTAAGLALLAAGHAAHGAWDANIGDAWWPEDARARPPVTQTIGMVAMLVAGVALAG